jgi:type I restriction enzyme S subunit
MKRYDNYKSSGVEWIGDVPTHWDVRKLKFVGESLIGITYSPDDVSANGSGTLVLRSSNIQNGALTFDDCVYVEKEIQPKHRTKTGDILICARNGSAHLVGKSAYIDEKASGHSFGAFMSIFRSDSGKFLYYFFNSQIFKAQTGLFSTSTINQLTSDTLNNLFVALPSDNYEQTAIAKYLDEKTEQIDTLIVNKRRLIELLKEERTAIINQAVTKGINEHAKLEPSGIDWLGDIPEHWKVKKLKYVANRVQTGSTPPSNQEEYYVDEINWFTPSDFTDKLLLTNSKRKIAELAVEKGVVKTFPANSLLMVGIGATLGKVGFIVEPATSNQQINAISFSNRELAVFYAYFFHVNQANIVSLANAATLAILNQSQTRDIPLPVPPTENEIKEILRFINHKESDFALTIEKIEKEIELMKEYRTALISEVVTGKIKVV